MSNLNFSGFYYIEGDTTNGFIDKALSYDDNLANNKTLSKYTYKDIVSKFEIPVILSYNNGMYASKYIVGENLEKTRTNIDPTGQMWKDVFSIANYIYNKFYVFAGRLFQEIDGRTMVEYINDVLAGKISDTTVVSTSLFEPYVDGSLEIHHVDERESSTYYYRLRSFKFKIVWSDEEYEFDMWVNPESFATTFESINPYIYVYYNYDEDDQRDTITEVSGNIADKILTNFKKILIPAMIENTPDGTTERTYEEVQVPFYIWSTEAIPVDPLNNSKFLKAIQDTIKTSENILSGNELAQRYPTVFEETERVIYPLVDNEAIDSYTYQDEESNELVVAPVDIAKLNQIIGTESSLSTLKAFESSTILVKGSYIPFIAGGIGSAALTDKVPFFRPSVEQIDSLGSYDETRIASAKEFVKLISSILDYQLNGALITDIRNDTNLQFVETQSYCTVKYLGIVWKIINRKYDISQLTS